MPVAAVVDEPWVVWSEVAGSGQPQFARLSEFNGKYIRGAPRHKIAAEAYDDLLSFLATERNDVSSILKGIGTRHGFDFFSRMWRTAVAMILYQRDDDDKPITNAEFCYMMGRTGLKVYERGFYQSHSRGIGPSPTWHRQFKQGLQAWGQKQLNTMEVSDSILVSHALMLKLVEGKLEDSERRHGRVDAPSIAEEYANKLVWHHPGLYAKYVYPLFREDVYGRPTLVRPIISDNSIEGDSDE